MKTILNKKFSLIFLIIATIGMISCSTSSPLIDNAKNSIKEKNYTAAQQSAEEYIQKNPQSPIGYYYKGVALGQHAQSLQEPSEATQYYKQMNDAFNTSESIARKTGKINGPVKNIGTIKASLWRDSHNSAIKYINNDSLKKTVSNPLKRSADLLQNATIIEPDSALSWDVLAIVQNKREKYGDAASAEKKYIELADSTTAKDYVLLAQYYRLDKQMQKSISALQEGQKKFPENQRLSETLADTYGQAGESDKSIEMVKALVKKNPKNPQYRLSYGTQVYKKALKVQNKYEKNNDKILDLQQKLRQAQGNKSKMQDLQKQIQNLKNENSTYEQKMDQLSQLSIKQLKTALQYRKNDKFANRTLGIIYQNKARIFFDKRNVTLDNEMANKMNDKANSLLKTSASYYQKAVNIDSSDTSSWRHLYQIYQALGMDKKAQEAAQKAGINS